MQFPGFDIAAKTPAYLKIKFQPESVQPKQNRGRRFQVLSAVRQRYWQAADFRFAIGGVELKRVVKLDAITIKQNIKESRAGEIPTTALVTVSDSSLGAWSREFTGSSWQKVQKQLNGSIPFLVPDSKAVLFRVTFSVAAGRVAGRTARTTQIELQVIPKR